MTGDKSLRCACGFEGSKSQLFSHCYYAADKNKHFVVWNWRRDLTGSSSDDSAKEYPEKWRE